MRVHDLAERGLLPDSLLAAMSDVRQSAWWARLLADPGEARGVFVADDEEMGVVGFGSCGLVRDPPEGLRGNERRVGEVYTLYVEPDFQNLGLGRRLLDALFRQLRADGCDTAVNHAAFLAAIKAEKAGCVDPYMVDPDPLFKWVADDVLKEVEIRAASNKVTSKRACAAVTQFFGLNREELKRWRWKTYANFVVLKDALQVLDAAGGNAALRTQIRDQIRAMTAVDAPYAGMVRYFVAKFSVVL